MVVARGRRLQAASFAAFAEQQRRLLAAYGVRMSARRSQALTYARSAIFISLPAGGAVSAGYAFEQFRGRGAKRTVAAAVMLLNGVAPVASLALSYAGVALVSAVWSGSRLAGPIGAVMLCRGDHRARARGRHDPVAAARSFDGDTPAAGTLLRQPFRALWHLATLACAVTVGKWLAVTGLALVNWLADLACLLAALRAVGLAVSTFAVATAYSTVQLVRQVLVTPGGIGVIEVSLLVALTAAGAAPAPRRGRLHRLPGPLVLADPANRLPLLAGARQPDARSRPPQPSPGSSRRVALAGRRDASWQRCRVAGSAASLGT